MQSLRYRSVITFGVSVIIICTFATLLLYHREENFLPSPAVRVLQQAAPGDVAPPAQGPRLPPGCSWPSDHVFFLKTHKCGSSTVQNILMRRGFARGLNFVLPEKANYLGHPELFSPDHIGPSVSLPDQLQQYEVFTHHTRYHGENVRRVMPADTKRVTILREPAALFESLFNYYDLGTLAFDGYQMSQLLKMSITDLRHLFENAPRLAGRVGYNQMSYDLGMKMADFGDASSVQSLIRLVERDFHLVMISEHMEASLVLLAELMCWPLEDVTFVKLNARPDKWRASMSKEEVDKLNQLNNVDMELYSFFKEQFKLKIIQYGVKRMEEDITRLIKLNQNMFDECISVEVQPKENTKYYPVIVYKVYDRAPKHCKLLIMDELKFTEHLRKQQLAKFTAIKKLKWLLSS